MENIVLKIKGMHCTSCASSINKALNSLDGVNASTSYEKSNTTIQYDENLVSLEVIKETITSEGYIVAGTENKTKSKEKSKENSIQKSSFGIDDILKIIIFVLAFNQLILMYTRINVLSTLIGVVNNLITNIPTINENTSYLFLFIIGLTTSFHCVAMCGGINVTQCIRIKTSEATDVVNNSNSVFSKISPNLKYNLGRVTSYTILGGIVGAIGSVFTLSLSVTAMLYIIIGIFMFLMGLNLFGVNIARKFLPRMPKIFTSKTGKNNSSYVIGLLNGLMPCGPLQSMQLYALSTGSFTKGALSMFFFSIGTVPLMYVFGKIGDFKNKDIAFKFLKISAILVIVLGVAMANRGLSLLGINVSSVFSQSSSSGVPNNSLVAEINGDEQVIYSELTRNSYPNITVKKGVKVKWILNATEETLNGCNNEIVIKEYGIKQKLNIGENIIEFTPSESGNFGYSCWMGMIRATITVVE